MPCSPGMTKCRRSCLHRSFVAEYRVAREAAEQEREAEVGLYGPGSTEWAEYDHAGMINFRTWLETMRGWNAPPEGT